MFDLDNLKTIKKFKNDPKKSPTTDLYYIVVLSFLIVRGDDSSFDSTLYLYRTIPDHSCLI